MSLVWPHPTCPSGRLGTGLSASSCPSLSPPRSSCYCRHLVALSATPGGCPWGGARASPPVESSRPPAPLTLSPFLAAPRAPCSLPGPGFRVGASLFPLQHRPLRACPPGCSPILAERGQNPFMVRCRLKRICTLTASKMCCS